MKKILQRMIEENFTGIVKAREEIEKDLCPKCSSVPGIFAVSLFNRNSDSVNKERFETTNDLVHRYREKCRDTISHRFYIQSRHSKILKNQIVMMLLDVISPV